MGHVGQEPKIIGGTYVLPYILKAYILGQNFREKTHQLWHKKGVTSSETVEMA